MSELHHLTYQLNGSEVFLPPQVLLVAGAHGGQAVVRVHDNVDDTVEQGVERPHTTWKYEGIRINNGHTVPKVINVMS